MFGFGKKRKQSPPQLPDPMVVAIKDLRWEVEAARKEAISARLQSVEVLAELGRVMHELTVEINKKRTIKIPLTLSVGKSK